MPDLVVGLGLDNRQYKQSLDASLTQTQVAALRIGQAFKTHTKPIKELAQGITSIGVVAGLATGAFGLITSVLFGLTQGLGTFGEENEEAARKVSEHAEKQRELSESIRRVIQDSEAARTGFARIGAFGDPIPKEVIDRVREIDRLINELDVVLPGSATSNDVFYSPQNQRALAEYNELLRERSRLIRDANESRIGDFTLQAEIDYLKSSGRLREAQVLEEGKLTAERRRRIVEIAGEDERLRKRLEDDEIRRHQQRLAEIDAEAERRRQQQEDQERRERELAEMQAKRIRQTQEDAALSIEAQEVERLRLTNQTKAADQLERQLEHRRRMLEIERMEGISEDQRRQLRENEIRNAALRGSQSPAFAGEVRQAPIGILNQRLLDRVFGPETQEDEATRIAKETLALLKQWRDAQRILIW